MKFSICIPNFNYSRYLGLTLDSVLIQANADFEICIADNNSDDGSQLLIQNYAGKNAQIKYAFNPTNLGFSDNLLAASQMARGDWQILLSSDDLIRPGALEFYKKFIQTVGDKNRFAFCAACDMIDGKGDKTGYVGPRSKVWQSGDIDEALSKKMGCNIYRATAKEMMERCLSSFYGFFNFASACYKSESYQAAGGYFGGRMYGPDKWFHWRLLTKVDEVFFIDKPLFAYRWHDQNQAALQQKNKALKYLVDEYRNVLEITPEMLQLTGAAPSSIERNFIEEVIAKQAFSSIKKGQATEAKRIIRFGAACFPGQTKTSFNIWAIKFLILLGPIGYWAARIIKPNF
ncbi:MAG: glycosyltransferase family 2 protein [Saprospiraceae bacterium]